MLSLDYKVFSDTDCKGHKLFIEVYINHLMSNQLLMSCESTVCLSFFIISESFMLDMPPGQTFCVFHLTHPKLCFRH